MQSRPNFISKPKQAVIRKNKFFFVDRVYYAHCLSSASLKENANLEEIRSIFFKGKGVLLPEDMLLVIQNLRDKKNHEIANSIYADYKLNYPNHRNLPSYKARKKKTNTSKLILSSLNHPLENKLIDEVKKPLEKDPSVIIDIFS